MSFTWQGRRLATASANGKSLSFKYNSDGIRTQKTVNGVTTYFTLDGSKIISQKTGDTTIFFEYDATGNVATMIYNGNTYYYVRNLMGEIIGLVDDDGVLVARYYYDPWGEITGYDSFTSQNIAFVNPFRYKGYYYDSELGFYYLNSRYYDPEICRFINADGYISTGQGILGNNMFAYCLNNPVNMIDHNGNKPGDLFDTMDEAALDFAMCYNAASIADMQEYGSAIYRVTTTTKMRMMFFKTYRFLWWTWTVPYIKTLKTTKTQYSYTEPSIGKNGSSVLPNLATTKPIVSTVHTHANYNPDLGTGNDNFSEGWFSDKWWSNVFKMDSYVVTPSGYLKKYTYANRNDSNGGVTVIPGDIPWDENSPLR